MATPALVAVAYLVGGIPFAWIVVRFTRGIDIRETGSGNIGATNAARVFPPRWRVPAFVFMFLLDACKGYVATAWLPAWFRAGGIAPTLGGAAAVVGHTFSPFLGFRGGKGVATTVGVLFGLEPLATAIALGCFFAVYGLTRVVGAGSIAFAFALPAAVFLLGRAPLEVRLLSVALGLLILLRHRSNIQRLLGRVPS